MGKPILYHQRSCGMCKAVEMMLQKRGIEYESRLVDEEANMEEAKRIGVSGTPALAVDGKVYLKRECLDWINSQGR